jgi:type III restriction enzyme
MVKLPVVVYNHHDKEDVINAALRLRKRLETLALAAHRKNGAPMIRPIVLFQAQPRNADEVADPMTYRKLKQQLRGLGIPEEHIKIKTGDLDELGRIDLLAPNCEVRYIITVNALKEGWDCSYAYILASLANRSSPVEVEQLVGRVLRQPRATHHPVALLNLSYVLTASAQFDRTLKHIVAGLNEAGFSKDDYRAIEAPNAQDIVTLDPGTQTTLALDPVAFDPVELDVSRLRPAPALPTEAAILAAEAELTPTGTLAQPPEVSTITHEIDSSLDAADVNAAAIEAAALTAFATAAASAHAATTEVVKQVKTYAMRKEVALLGQNLRLPYFVRPAQGMFAEPELLERGDLLAGFDLTKKRIDLRFDSMPTDMWQIDVEQQENGYAPRLQKPNERLRQELIAVFESSSPAGQRRAVVKELTKLLSLRQNTVSDGKLKTYLEKVFADASPAMLREAKERADDYAQVIRRFINQEQTAHALDEFEAQLISSDLVAGLPYSLPSRRTVVRPANPLAQSLYEQEEDGNTLEADMMSILASAENIAFWTRNPALIKSGGFRLNGPVLNHFPDFITQTRKGKVLLIETKGDDRDNSDSAAKIRLGKAWETAASKTWEGSSATSYHYFMVFKTAGLPGSFSVPKFLEQLARL